LGTALTQIFPKKALQRVKHYLRRDCRKPTEMKVREYYQHIQRINIEEVTCLPPYNPAQALSNDEILDILLFGTPKSWQREMDRQGFDPLDHTLQEVIAFMEQIEMSEDFDAPTQQGQKSKGKGKQSTKPKQSGGGDKYCLIHGKGGHSSDECHKLQAEAKKLKSSHGGSKLSDKSGKFTNKTWTRKADETNDKSKKDLAAFVKKAISKGVQKELASVDKKRKASDKEIHAFDMDDLKDFNYEDMDNLKIDSDDDISI